MSIDLRQVGQTAFSPDFVQEVIKDKPVECVDELVDTINEVRKGHDGIIVFDKEAVKLRDYAGLDPVSGSISTIGWHVHNLFDATLVSRGSEVKTLVTNLYNIPPVVLDGINRVRQVISYWSEKLQDLSFSVLDAEENFIDLPAVPLYGHVQIAEYHLRRALDARHNDADTVTALHLIRQMIGQTLTTVEPELEELRTAFRNIAIRAQINIPRDQILTLSPQEHSAYVVPAGLPHARSILEGQLTRAPHEDSMGFGIDAKTRKKFTRTQAFC